MAGCAPTRLSILQPWRSFTYTLNLLAVFKRNKISNFATAENFSKKT